MPDNTPNRDRDYGMKGNLSYEQFKLTAAYEIGVVKRIGSPEDLQKLYDTLLDQLENPKILGFIPAPKSWIDKDMQAGGREGIQDAFLAANIPLKPRANSNQR
jgi:hypothetical protein